MAPVIVAWGMRSGNFEPYGDECGEYVLWGKKPKGREIMQCRGCIPLTERSDEACLVATVPQWNAVPYKHAFPHPYTPGTFILPVTALLINVILLPQKSEFVLNILEPYGDQYGECVPWGKILKVGNVCNAGDVPR